MLLKSKCQWSEKAKLLLKNLNNFANEGSSQKHCIPLVVDDCNVGILSPLVVKLLSSYTHVFDTKDGKYVTFCKEMDDQEKRTKAVAEVTEDLRKKEAYSSLKGWRDELYDVSLGPNYKSMFEVERAACPMFGVKAFGAHMNGYVNHSTLGLCIWIATRSFVKPTYPGKLDNMVAGGISTGYGVAETLVKECEEEAGVPQELAEKAQPVGMICYTLESERGIQPECQYCFDLEIPESFQPVVVDGEVHEFNLHPIEKVKELIVEGNFKPNSAAVTLDFMFRRGYIKPDEVDDYIGMIQLLRCW